ncbi:MAG TPA: four helix bundle protein [Polyangia bacterium]|nr:four helix bundle protein [Polyangia bacterium]
MNDNHFSFQRLDVYRVAKEALAISIEHRGCWRRLPGELGPQLERAMASVVLNIAEGAGRWSAADQRRHYQIACGSANEVGACLDLAALYGNLPQDVQVAMTSRLLRVVQMLKAMIRRR